MKPFTPIIARNYKHIDLQADIIQIAYCQLISENIDNPVRGAAEFTQGTLIGRIHYLGLNPEMNAASLITGALDQEIHFKTYWTIITHPEFYSNLNSHSLIQFVEK